MGAWAHCTDFAVAYKATGWLLWFIWSVLFASGLSGQPNKQDKPNKPDKPQVLGLAGRPRLRLFPL